jgi:hypothetical protein
VTFLKYL